jgi:hypothetical protein
MQTSENSYYRQFVNRGKEKGRHSREVVRECARAGGARRKRLRAVTGAFSAVNTAS